MNPFIGIVLALACALAGNVAFLYKHRGACAAPAVDMRRPMFTARSLFGSPLFAIGMLIAVAAWILHVAAMAIAPLSLVQAVLAGGVVLLAVMAERFFGLRIGRRQWIGLGLTATGLLLLAVTLPGVRGARSSYSRPDMIVFEASLIATAALLMIGPMIGASQERHGFMLGAAAGILFGVSDVAIKGISGIVGSAGVLGLLTPWAGVALAASIAAFFSSAKALQDGDPVPVIAITSTAANVAGIVGGIAVFGDRLPDAPVLLVAQCVAVALVLTAAWLMPAPVRAAAPEQIVHDPLRVARCLLSKATALGVGGTVAAPPPQEQQLPRFRPS
jgi:drug/metabolite transporter (DMT)-like permease